MKKSFWLILIGVFIIAVFNIPSVNAAGVCSGTGFVADCDYPCGGVCPSVGCYEDPYDGRCDVSGNPTCSDVTNECECTADNCTWIPDSCSDTDSGFDYLTPGHITGFQSGTSFFNRDTCSSNTTLTEQACTGNNPTSVSHACTDGRICYSYGFNSDDSCQCQDCYVFDTTLNQCMPNYSCTDSDGGANQFIGGYTSGCTAGSPPGSDYCVNSTTVMEYYCIANTKNSFSQIACPLRGSCVGGGFEEFAAYCACDDPNYPVYKSGTDECVECVADSDCASSQVCLPNNTCKDVCPSASVGTNNAGCQATAPSYSTDVSSSYYCPTDTCYQCNAGYNWDGSDCVLWNSCSDDEVPVNYSIRGTVSGALSGAPYSISDYCSLTTGYLQEYYCSGSSAVFSDVNCDGGRYCSNGACICDPDFWDGTACVPACPGPTSGTIDAGCGTLVTNAHTISPYYCSSGSCYQCNKGYQWNTFENSCQPVQTVCYSTNPPIPPPDYLTSTGSDFCCPSCIDNYDYDCLQQTTWFGP